MRIMGKSRGFRTWFYFRTGWSMYFAFVLSAVNTLTVTYYLAIEQIPVLKEAFPSFLHYIIIFVVAGVPILVSVGYAHFKRTAARKAEVDISVETNPYMVRILVNTEFVLKLLQNNQKLTKKEIDDLLSVQTELSAYMKTRTFAGDRDFEFFKKIGEGGFK